MSLKRSHAAATIAVAATLIGASASSASASTKSSPATPDINRVNCALAGDPLVVWQSYGENADCFENVGEIDVNIYNFDSVYTGNNGTFFTLDLYGKYFYCSEPYADSWVTASECGAPYAESDMVFLQIYPHE
jgi:hypothetical protein